MENNIEKEEIIPLTNEQKLEYLSKLILDLDKKFEEKEEAKKLVKSDKRDIHK